MRTEGPNRPDTPLVPVQQNLESDQAPLAGSPVRTATLAWPTWLCAFAPAGLTLALLTGAGHARLALGHWPNFGESIPSAGWSLHEFVISWNLATAAVVAPSLWLLLTCWPAFRGSSQMHVRQVKLFAVLWLLLIAWITHDPGGFFQWLMD